MSNVEGWNRFAQSFFKLDRSAKRLMTSRLHYFEIRHLSAGGFNSLISFSIWLAAFQASGWAALEPLNPEP
jgi:hypothetical protein